MHSSSFWSRLKDIRAYIGVTDPYWLSYLKKFNHQNVVFWRKSSRPVNLVPGDYFFFLIRGSLPRPIVGFGIIDHVAVKQVHELWNNFKEENGCGSLEDLKVLLGKTTDDKVAYYYVKNVNYLGENDPQIFDYDIGFAKNIMAGKFISNHETLEILSRIKNQ